MPRKVELGAGIAAGVLAALVLLVLLLAPVVAYCAVPFTRTCPAGQVRTTTLVQAHASFGTWLYLLSLLALLFVGAAGAVAEARFGRRRGALALWIAAVLAFMGCSFTAAGIGVLYAPAVFALALAGYASVLQRLQGRGGQHQQTNS